MTEALLPTNSYEGRSQQVSWRGVSMEDGERFNAFLNNEVASRFFDEEATAEFEAHLRGLANTGFARDSLGAILGPVHTNATPRR